MSMKSHCKLAGCLLLLMQLPAWGQNVALTGVMGQRALLVIDGGTPAVVAPGETREGVRLISVSGDVAVLTYILVQHRGTEIARWNASQVYQHKKEGWRVIHSHWSVTR